MSILDRDRVCRVLGMVMLVMLTVWYLQFYQVMILTSLVVSLVPVTILSLQSQSDMPTASGQVSNLGLSGLRVSAVTEVVGERT